MAISTRRIIGPTLAAFTLVLAGLMLVSAFASVAQAAPPVNHGSVVPENPRTNTPKVLDGTVYAHAQVGTRIFVAGDFTSVQLPDGSTVDQPRIFAYNINTGDFDIAFRPLVNNTIRALEPAPNGDGLYVGGLFTQWDGTFQNRIVKLDAQGNLNTSFDVDASARVYSIAARADKVFIGGDFTTVSGQNHVGLAALDSQTGAVDAGFQMDVQNTVTTNNYVRTVVLSSDGNTLYTLHYGDLINGQPREAVAKIDVSGPIAALVDWRIEWEAQAGQRSCRSALRDLAISPDDSFIVIGGQGADFPPNCDSVLRYPTAGTGAIAFQWAARMYSSVYSLAVSDVAVYAGGHFCAAPKNPIPPGGISSDFTGTANNCEINDPTDPSNPSERDPDNAVFRKQMAALDATTGQALPWDPGSNNFRAVWDLTVIDRGLLAGHDRDRFNDVFTGRSGFFDFGAPADTTPPTMVVSEPAPGTSVADPARLAGSAADNVDIASVTIRLKNITTDTWLQTDGTFGPNQADLPATFTPTGLGTADWSYDLNGLEAANYEVRGFSTDAAGNTSTPLVSPFAVNTGPACMVALNGDDQPVLSWTDFDGEPTQVFLRRDGSYLATGSAGSSTYTDTTVAAGDHSYLVRWRPNGPAVDVPCTPDPITVPDDGGTAVCTVALNADDDPVLSWADVPANNIAVREATGWIATVTGVTSYTVTDALPGEHSYLIRYSGTDLPCTPQPIVVPSDGNAPACTAVLNADDDPVLSWTDVPADTVVIREATGWVDTVEGVTSYTVLLASPGDHSYLIRFRGIDVPCTPQPITVPDGGGPGPEPLACTVELDGDGNVLVTWTAVQGESRYSVRTQNGWVATVANDLTYLDTDPDPGPQSYVVRYKDDGANVDTTCTPDPIDV